MAGSAPRISVGMPVYNGAPYVEAAIESVLKQTESDFELIIADNASTDGTQTICERLARTDPRIRYVRNRVNLGAARNYNLLVELARAPYFRWHNADDLAAPEAHARCLGVLEQRPDAVLAYCRTRIIDAEGKSLSDYDDRLDVGHDSAAERLKTVLDRIGLTNVIYGLMRTAPLRRTGLMGDGRLAAADIVLVGSLSLHGKFVEVPERLFFRRMHELASSWDRKDVRRQAAFWGGARRSGFTLPTLRQYAAFQRAIAGARLPLGERVALQAYMFRRLYWSKASVLAELVEASGITRFRSERAR